LLVAADSLPILITVLWTPVETGSASMRTTVVVLAALLLVVAVAAVAAAAFSGISKRWRSSRLAVAQRSYSSLRLKQEG